MTRINRQDGSNLARRQGSAVATVCSPFDWRREAQPAVKAPADYPQKAYYWRRKAGITGTRQAPDRHWRKAVAA